MLRMSPPVRSNAVAQESMSTSVASGTAASDSRHSRRRSVETLWDAELPLRVGGDRLRWAAPAVEDEETRPQRGRVVWQ
jgi:hypothetical protein